MFASNVAWPKSAVFSVVAEMFSTLLLFFVKLCLYSSGAQPLVTMHHIWHVIWPMMS